MQKKHNRSKSARSFRVDHELLLQSLLLEHARIGEEIIALLSKTSVETEKLIQTMEKETGEPRISLRIQ